MSFKYPQIEGISAAYVFELQKLWVQGLFYVRWSVMGSIFRLLLGASTKPRTAPLTTHCPLCYSCPALDGTRQKGEIHPKDKKCPEWFYWSKSNGRQRGDQALPHIRVLTVSTLQQEWVPNVFGESNSSLSLELCCWQWQDPRVVPIAGAVCQDLAVGLHRDSWKCHELL